MSALEPLLQSHIHRHSLIGPSPVGRSIEHNTRAAPDPLTRHGQTISRLKFAFAASLRAWRSIISPYLLAEIASSAPIDNKSGLGVAVIRSDFIEPDTFQRPPRILSSI